MCVCVWGVCVHTFPRVRAHECASVRALVLSCARACVRACVRDVFAIYDNNN